MLIKRKMLILLLGGTFLLRAVAADKIGVTVYNGNDPFLTSIVQTLKNEVQNQKDTQLVILDSKNDQSKQNEQIEALLNSGVKVLLVNLVDPKAGQWIVDKAKVANIPIIFFNKDPGRAVIRSYEKSYYVGADPVQSGIIQGDLIAKGWRKHPEWDKNEDGKLQFALFKGEQGHPDAIARSEWVVKELAQKQVFSQKLMEDYADWDANKAKAIAKKWFASPLGNQIEMIIANNDMMAIGAQAAAKEYGYTIPIYGIDAIPKALQMVADNELAGTVLNDASAQATAMARILPALILGYTPDEYTGYVFNDRYLRVPYIPVDKENLHDFLQK